MRYAFVSHIFPFSLPRPAGAKGFCSRFQTSLAMMSSRSVLLESAFPHIGISAYIDAALAVFPGSPEP